MAAFLTAFLAAFCQPILYRPGVADLFSGNAGKVTRLSKWSRLGYWLSSSRLSHTTCCFKNTCRALVGDQDIKSDFRLKGVMIGVTD